MAFKKKDDHLSLEMARFEQEVLGVAVSAPPKPRTVIATVSAPPTPLFPPKTTHHPSLQHNSLLLGYQSSTPVSLLGIQAVKDKEDKTGLLYHVR
jgi:hypothetical protein